LRWEPGPTYGQRIADPTPTPWGVAFKGADRPISDPSWKTAKLGAGSGSSVSFTILPGANETDQFYQSESYWRIYPDDLREPTAELPGYGTVSDSTVPVVQLYLTLTAYRDPDWVDRGNR
jgi:hypothetical protein